jgi:hypothetical protein
MTKKKQHQLSVCYLKRFVDEDGFVWTYDAQTERVTKGTPQNTAVESHLYSVTLEDGSHITAIEDMLAEIEAKAGTPLEKLATGQVVTGQERADLASFFAMTFVRTNSFRRQFAEVIMKGHQVFMHAIASNDATFRTMLRKYEKAEGELTEEQRKALRHSMLNPSKFTIEVAKPYTLRALATHDAIMDAIYKMRWSLVVAPANYYFITSDNPLVKMLPTNKERRLTGGGFLDPSIECTLPITPRLCWLGHWQKGVPPIAPLPVSAVKEMNRLRAVHAERVLFAHKQDSGIKALAIKYRDDRPEITVSGLDRQSFAPVTIKRGGVGN